MRKSARVLLRRVGMLRRARAIFRSAVGVWKDLHYRLLDSGVDTDDGLPLPPPGLCFRSAISYDPAHFLSSGVIGAEAVEGLLEGVGRLLSVFGTVLDFGCGCCRVSRHLMKKMPDASFQGTDIDERAVRWVNSNIPRMKVTVMSQGDPLPYGEGTFDLVMAVAVFPLLNAEHQLFYLGEIRRVLAPGGILLLTLKGAGRRHELSPEARTWFDAGQAVVVEPESSGSIYCLAYHPEVFVRNTLVADYETLDFKPRGSADTSQDSWILRKPE